MNFDPWNRSLKFWEFTRTPSSKVGVALGVWEFTPSHFLTLSRIYDVTPKLLLVPQPCNPFALVASPRLGLQHLYEVEKGMAMAFNIVEVFHFKMFIFIINANCTLNVCTNFNDMVIKNKCIYVFKMERMEKTLDLQDQILILCAQAKQAFHYCSRSKKSRSRLTT